MLGKIKPIDIDLMVYDFDGVLTDNRILIFEDGSEAVFCNRADGLSIQKIKELGISQIILSTEKNRVVKTRARKLSIEVIHGVTDKKTALKDYCKEKKYNLKKVLYIGNDINDRDAMNLVGWPVAPADAHQEIKKIARIVLSTKGGCGVVRELLDKLRVTND